MSSLILHLLLLIPPEWFRWSLMLAALVPPQWLQTLQWGLFIFFMTPLVEVVMMVVGYVWYLTRYKRVPDKHKALIMQITTVGREPELVNRTLERLRSYNLSMLHEIWVVIEPGHETNYPLADTVIVVPKGFIARSVDKARALEFVRPIHEAWAETKGIPLELLKLLFIDDDTLPTEEYVEAAFEGDYDLCQGITVPSRQYAGASFMHFLLSHMDNIRTRNCLIYCSCTEGVTGKPLFVHGEGLCITAYVEKMVGWDWPIIASDDLTFGLNAAYMGYSWGFFYREIQLVSPWSWKENISQRHRWTWGNFKAIWDREILPQAAGWFKGFKYAFGLLSVFASTIGAVLLFQGIAKVPPQVHGVFWTSLGCWVASYAFCGWVNSGGDENRERFAQRKGRQRSKIVAGALFWGFRVLQTFMAAVLCPMTAIVPAFVIIYSALKGPPKKFVTINKTRPAAK